MDAKQDMDAVDASLAAHGASPVGTVVARRGRTLSVEDTVADAHRVFAHPSVTVVPVTDDRRYVGALTRDLVAAVAPDESVGAVASPTVPTVAADVPLMDALALLEPDGTRLVVLDPVDGSYVGVVCLTPARDGLCIGAECHEPTTITSPTAPGGRS